VIFVLSNRFLKTFAISAKPKKSLTHQTSSKHFLKDANLRPFKECRHSSGMFNHFNACPSRAEDRTKSTNFHAIILVDFVGENVNHDYGAITGVDSVKRPAWKARGLCHLPARLVYARWFSILNAFGGRMNARLNQAIISYKFDITRKHFTFAISLAGFRKHFIAK
jgi:hypothetical protein